MIKLGELLKAVLILMQRVGGSRNASWWGKIPFTANIPSHGILLSTLLLHTCAITCLGLMEWIRSVNFT